MFEIFRKHVQLFALCIWKYYIFPSLHKSLNTSKTHYFRIRFCTSLFNNLKTVLQYCLSYQSEAAGAKRQPRSSRLETGVCILVICFSIVFLLGPLPKIAFSSIKSDPSTPKRNHLGHFLVLLAGFYPK